MGQRIVIAFLRAIWFTALLDVWIESSCLSHYLDFMLYPGSALLGRLVGPATTYQQGFILESAWALGPVVLIVNSLSYLFITLPLVYLLHIHKYCILAFAGIALSAGVLSLARGAYWGFEILKSWGYPLGTCYDAFFIYLPMLVLGAIGMVQSWRIVRCLFAPPRKV